MQRNHRTCRLHFFFSTRRLGPLSNRAGGHMQVSPRISGKKPGHLRFPSFFLCCCPVADAREQTQSQVSNVSVPAHSLPAPPRELEKPAIGRQRREQAIHDWPTNGWGSLLGCGAPGWTLSKLSFDCLPTSSQYSLTKMIDSMSESLATHCRVIREQPRHPGVLGRSIS